MKKEMLYGPLGVVILWYLIYWLHIVNPLFLPPPHTVLVEFCQMIVTLAVWKDIAASLWRILAGFLLAALLYNRA